MENTRLSISATNCIYNIDDDLICPICQYPFCQPVVHAKCGNTFCNECADPLKPCPMCHDADFASLCFPAANNVRNQLDKLKVFYPMCQDAVKRGELKDHQEKYCSLHEAYQQVGKKQKYRLEKQFEEKNNNTKLEQVETIHLNVGEKQVDQQIDTVFHSSTILNSKAASLIFTSLKLNVSQCSLLYRGSRDGFTAQTFHSRCDSKSPTLTIIKSQHNQIFGGFTTQTWNHTDDCKPDSEAFIFKYHDSTCTFEILPVTRPEKAIYCHSSYLAVFGGISITDKCNENMNCCNLGRSYSLPESLKQQNLKYRDAQVQSYLAGSYKFKVSEIEVYQV